MATITSAYGALTLAVTKVANLAATNVVVGFIDEFNRGRQYNPLYKDGLAPQTGDAASKWLPSVVSVTQVLDSTGAATGPWKVVLSPGTGDTVNVASVQTVLVDQNALFITATSTF